jgi:putative membrane protein
VTTAAGPAPAPPVSGSGTAARLHPLTPFARGWAAMAAATIALGRDSLRTFDLPRLSLILLAVAVVGLGLGGLSWWFTKYSIEGDDLRVDSGVLFRRTRHIRLSRLQAVDVVRPLVARFVGLAELRLEVAGGSNAEGRLAYLSESVAKRLRAELLARAAGLHPDEPEAPEQVLIRVPTSTLVGSVLLSSWFVGAAAFSVVLVTVAVAAGELAGLVGLAPAALAIGAGAWKEFAGGFDFTVAESPDGLRLRHGLIEHRSQTVPPGRVQSLRLVEPLLWRRRGWARVQVNVAGYAGGGEDTRSATSVLLPVAPRPVALALIGRILPGVDLDSVPLAPAPRAARWARPIWWRGLACGADDRVFIARRGLVQRQLDVIPHGKTQSVRMVQGPWQRRLGLATVHLDTTPGPVRVDVAHRAVAEARAITEAQAARARAGRMAAGPERWMTQAQPTP